MVSDIGIEFTLEAILKGANDNKVIDRLVEIARVLKSSGNG